MISSELDAAGVRDPALRDAYRRCRDDQRAARAHLLPGHPAACPAAASRRARAVRVRPARRRHPRRLRPDVSTAERADAAATAGHRSCSTGWCRAAPSDGDPALAAVVHTARKYGIAWELFDDFLGSMRMDLTITDYPDRAALDRYMYGSAEVIGLQLLPVLGTVGPREEAAPYAAALGKAFQLTNFLRDIDEDLQRGRVYLPADELAAHGVDRDVLTWCHDQSAHRRRGCVAR